ncbi:tRNA-dihydrouridine synthase, partial [uncultured Campylobacter sp.]|uniref:tRNA-dihydrouridine synthase n=1 Tax=uncultured Campylobacter sp. TaxID=218934 RepID=UPI0026221022
EIKTGERASDALKREVVLYHFSQMLSHYGSHGVAIFRKHLHEYSKGRENAASFREQINHVTTESEMTRLIEKFFS